MKSIKKFKYNLIAFMLIAFSMQTLGQTATVVKGPSYKMSKINWTDIDPMGEDGAGHYYLLYPFLKRDKGCFIGRVSQKDMKIEEIKNLELTYGKNELELQFGLELGGTSYIFSSFQNNKLHKVFLFAHVLDQVGLGLKGDPIPIAEIDYSKFSKYKSASFSYRLSPDRSKILFIHNLLDNNESLLASAVTVADEQLQALYQASEITLAETGAHKFENYYLSNSGTVFILSKYFDTKKDYRKAVNLKRQGVLSNISFWEEMANFDYQITKMDKGVQKTFTLSLPAAFITQVELTTKNDGGILCVGFYSENEDAIPDGLFTQEISNQLIATHTDQKSLEGKFDQPLKYVNNSYKGKRNDLSHFRFDIKNIITRKEGGYAFAAERSVTLTETIKTGPNTYSNYGIFHTDDILLADIKQDGKINWVKQIEKSQEIPSSGGWTRFGSFAVEENNNTLLLFFTNNLDKHSFKSLSFKVFETESVMVMVRPDETSTKQVLFTAAADQVTLLADKTSKTSNGSFVLYGLDGNFLVSYFKVSF